MKRKAGRGRRGFTLIELVVAIGLSVMIVLSLMSLYFPMFRQESQASQQDVIQNSALMSLKMISSDLEKATYLTAPNPPCPTGICASYTDQPGDALAGCENYDPSTGSAFVSAPIHAFKYCVSNSGAMLSTWWDSPVGATACCPFDANYACSQAAFACNSTAPNFLVLGQLISKDRGHAGAMPNYDNYFYRTGGLNNVVQLHYQVGLGTAAATINTSISLSIPYNFPYP